MTPAAPDHLKLVEVPDDLDAQIAETEAAMQAAEVRDVLQRDVTVLPPGEERWNDLANAERFLSQWGEDLRYCVEAERWFLYDGKHWQSDNTLRIAETARRFVKAELEAAIVSGHKERIKNADRLNNTSGFDAMMKMARFMRATPIGDFDADATHYLVNCDNGTLDLRTGKLLDHNRDDLITRIIRAEYHADAVCPQFDAFLATILPDADVRAFVQRSIGYSLLGVVRERSFWILYGSGNNGKSVFIDLFMSLLADYACGTTSESIMDAKRAAGSANTDIARLKGKRFVTIPETNENERINAALIKALSAGDVITARHLFKEFFDFPFTGKMWIATNHKPTITDHSKGFWDRLKLVPFTVDIPDSQVVKKDVLIGRLMAERDGVLAWAVRGCRDYLQHDSLQTPAVIQAEIDQYKFEQDSIAQFLAECCQTIEKARENAALHPGVEIRESDFRVSNSMLYEAYKSYCKENGEKYPRAQKRLSQNMKERGFRQLNSGGRYWEGLRLVGE